jgi:hypothetical protein
MKPFDQSMEYPVAVHRWFSSGEGWAYHPDLSGFVRELADTVKQELEGRTPHFGKPWSHGYLLGCQIPDSECPDSRARGRAPAILRVVSLPREPLPEARDRLVTRLAELKALQSGHNESLRIPVSEDDLARSSARRVSGRSAWWKGWAAFMAIGTVVALAICFLRPGYLPDGDGTWFDEPIRALFTSWRIDIKPAAQPADLRKQFFDELAQDACADATDSQHPDARFWRRLPEHGPTTLATGGGDNYAVVNDLHPQLKELAKRVAIRRHDVPDSPNELKPAERVKELPLLFKVIEEGMDYPSWLAKQKWNQGDFSETLSKFPWDDPSPPRVRKKVVAHYLARPHGNSSLRKDDLLTMVKQLNAWQVKGVQEEDAEDRPWFVCDCYLAYLSQSRFGKLPDEPSWYVAFVSRLPMTPAINMADRECKKDFTKDALLPLARRLGMEPSDLILTSTLLNDIADRLAYEGWRKDCESQIDKRAAKLAEDLASAAPDCRKKTEEYDILPYGTVKIEVARDTQNRPMLPKIDKKKLQERSKNDAINDFVERFWPHGAAQKDKTPDQ